jgi:L,D-transpeptidase ErfK/SrfK
MAPLPLRAWALLALLLGLAGCAGWNKPVELALPPPQPERHRFALSGNQELIGQVAALETAAGDTLPDIARHYGLGFQQIKDANPALDEWIPPPGTRVTLPLRFVLPDAPRRGIVVNLAAMRLFYFPADRPSREVGTYPVGIGREGWSTPEGEMKILDKEAFPVWHVPESVREEHAKKGDPLPASVPAGPDNPLGNFAFYLSKPSYLMHGTNKPYGVGLRASHGCLRLYPEDISALFREVAVKTPLRVVNQPYLIGHSQGVVYLEAHRPFDELNEKKLRAQLRKKLAKESASIDWKRVDYALDVADGVPVPVSQGAPNPPAPLLSHPARLDGAPEPVPPIGPADWSVQVLNTPDDAAARRLAAMLNHQGPRIPAQMHETAGRYQVLAGPFASAAEGRKILHRLRADLELQGDLLAPSQTAPKPARKPRAKRAAVSKKPPLVK